MLNKNYILLWIGQFISQIGNRLYLMALAWYFVAVLNNNNGLFLLFIISSLPSLLLGIFAGPLIEKWNKKRIIVVCDILSGILTALLALIVYQELNYLPLVYLICFLLNSINLLFSPSVNSILPDLLPSSGLQKGMSYMKMITFLGQILGAAIGGILVGLWGVCITILVNSISFFISAGASLFISYSPKIRQISNNYLLVMKEGLSYVKNNPLIYKLLTITISSNLFIPVIVVLIPIIIKQNMGLDAIHFGIADAMLPLGAIIIAFLLSKSKKEIKPLKILSLGIAGVAICFIGTACFQYYAIILVCMLLYGCLINYINIKIITYFLRTVDGNYRGRFFSILESFSYASISISYVIVSITSDIFSANISLIISGIGLLIVSYLAYYWSSSKKFKTQKITD